MKRKYCYTLHHCFTGPYTKLLKTLKILTVKTRNITTCCSLPLTLGKTAFLQLTHSSSDLYMRPRYGKIKYSAHRHESARTCTHTLQYHVGDTLTSTSPHTFMA